MSSGRSGAVVDEASAQGLKKGPWTAAEDAILTEYVKKHGEGNWNAVQKNSGLMRCGKSCRLRWANHLRPNLKKGSFSPEEERIIIELHAMMGNKWARMAAQLPGRTDNEIKNYWNTRLKRRQRAGLPLYPQDIQEETASFHIQKQQKRPNSSSSLSSSLSSASSHPSKRACLNPFSNPSINLIPPDSFTNNYQQFNVYSCDSTSHENTSNNCFGFSLSLSSSSSSNDLYNQNVFEFISKSSETNNNNIQMMTYSSLLMGEQIEPVAITSGPEVTELPSNQIPKESITSDITSSDENGNGLELIPVSNSGLLDALLEESHALSRCGRSREIRVLSAVAEKEKREVEGGNDQVEQVVGSSREVGAENRLDDLTSSDQSSIETNPKEALDEDVNPMMDDDDLVSLLNNFPSSTPLPDWYRGSSNPSGGSYFSSSKSTSAKDLQSTVTSSELDSILGSCYWNNMPGIC